MAAIDLAESAINAGKLLTRIGGYAGTGKTTILKEIYNRCPGGAIVAFAGKACDVLRRKGLPGQTIHSLIYKFNSEVGIFELVDFNALKSISWLGVDEGSMVGSSLWSDVVSFKKPMLVIGDPGQLEPVNDDDPHLMKDPDFVLEEIHRQALNNPIIKLSMEIRAGDEIRWGKFERPLSSLLDPEELKYPDMFVCGYNRTRLALNIAIRKLRKYSDKYWLFEGERIVCKSNDRKLGVFNGQQFTVVKVLDGKYNLVTVDGKDYHNVVISDLGFNRLEKLSWNIVKRYQGKAMIADYGYAGTCHSSQGSEWDKVSYVDEQCHLWCPVRHRYTGVTRAASELRVFKDKFSN